MLLRNIPAELMIYGPLETQEKSSSDPLFKKKQNKTLKINGKIATRQSTYSQTFHTDYQVKYTSFYTVETRRDMLKYSRIV